MKLPKKIKDGVHELKIEFPYEFPGLGQNTCADYSQQLQRIRLSAVFDGEERKFIPLLVTLVHEMGHHIDLKYSLGLFNDDVGHQKLDVLSEAVVQILLDNANQIVQMLVDNGWRPYV